MLAATSWKNNSELILDCVKLGYLKEDWLTLDATFGLGNWWRTWTPRKLVTNDLYTDADIRADFRKLPFPDSTFDAVTYDPPYVCVGGRSTSTLPDLHNRFGLRTAPTRPAGVQEQMHEGLTECYRVLKRRGMCLAKCQDYVWAGKLWPGTHYMLTHALELGFVLVDRLEHIGVVRPQPPGRRQLHARRNLSTLLILQRRPL